MRHAACCYPMCYAMHACAYPHTWCMIIVMPACTHAPTHDGPLAAVRCAPAHRLPYLTLHLPAAPSHPGTWNMNADDCDDGSIYLAPGGREMLNRQAPELPARVYACAHVAAGSPTPQRPRRGAARTAAWPMQSPPPRSPPAPTCVHAGVPVPVCVRACACWGWVVCGQGIVAASRVACEGQGKP